MPSRSFIYILGCLLLCVPVSGQSPNPYASLLFDKLVMYAYNGADKGAPIVNQQGELDTTVIKQAMIDPRTAKRLNSRLGDIKSFGSIAAACFEPHLGFVYYRKGKAVAHLDICLACNRLRSSLRIKAQEQGRHGTGRDVYYQLDGMSPAFRQFLNGLLIRYHFSDPLKAGVNRPN